MPLRGREGGMDELTQKLEQRYLDALRRLRRETGHLEHMARWKEDLAARLWQSRTVLHLTGEALHDAHKLEEEVRLYRLVCDHLEHRSK